MRQSQQLANRFREVILNGKWVANTNFKDQINNLPFDIAEKKVGAFNTIAILAQHIHYYIAGVKKVLEGGSLDIRDAQSFDFSPITSQQAWEAFLAKFWSDSEAFAMLVEKLEDTQLQAPFVDEKYGTYLRNMDGMIEHCYYHLGQIVWLKKLLSENSSF
ncbi:MAG: DUF1572 domain-containing protein [Flavobacteriaceae bacterium]